MNCLKSQSEPLWLFSDVQQNPRGKSFREQ